MSGKENRKKIVRLQEHTQSSPAQVYRADIARDKNVIGKKIAEARKMANLKQAEFAELLRQYGVDITPQALSRWETGVVMPNAYQLLAASFALGIAEPFAYFTGVTPAIAQELNAKGMRRLQEYKEFLVFTGRYAIHPSEGEDAAIAMAEHPVGDLPLSAGTGNFIDESLFEMVSFPAHVIPEESDFALRVSGDSMEPVYHDGQYVFIEKCDTLHPGEVGAFILDGKGYIKVYKQQAPSAEEAEEFTDSYGILHQKTVLFSYNKAYAPIPVGAQSALLIVGRVLN